MATITERRYTPEDILRITDRPKPDLVDGHLEERELMGQRADLVSAKIIRLLGNHADETSSGYVNGSEGGYQIFRDDPRKVRFPDASFTRKERMPKGPAEGHSRVAPDLVVEVISPKDLATRLRRKIRDYLDAGVPLIWVANPDTHDILVIRADGSATLLDETKTLDGGDVLPGFSCPVAKLFA